MRFKRRIAVAAAVALAVVFSAIVPGMSAVAASGTLAGPAAVSASTQIVPQFAAALATDGDPSTAWSSAISSTPAVNETLTLDLGSRRPISAITLTPRDGGAFPVDFAFESSSDGQSWSTLPGMSFAGYPNPGSSPRTFHLAQPAQTRWVRLHVTRTSQDSGGHYYVQVAEFTVADSTSYAALAPTGVDASTQIVPTYSDTNAIDHDSSSAWSSSIGDAQQGVKTDWLSVDFGSVKNIAQVVLVPRQGGAFPRDFSLQSSSDGQNWSQISGQSYTSYPTSGTAPQSFAFSAPVSARFLRLTVTKESTDSDGHYYAQIAEFQALASAKDLPLVNSDASSTVSADWVPDFARDHDPSTGWSSQQNGTTGGDWLSVRLAGSQSVAGITLTPRAGGQGFPTSFRFQTSTDGNTWSDIPGQSYANYPNPGPYDQYFGLATPVTTGWLRLAITGLGTDSGGAHYAQIAEISATTLGALSNAAPSPRIVTTTNPTEDAVVADYVATDAPYGADPTGVSDSTAAIQRAIDDAFAAGGGTVWLPSGTYKVTGTVEIDPYVVLRGDWRDPDSGSGSYGTVISAQPAPGANGPVLFEMRGNAAAEGLTIYYPSQNAASPTAYNYTFRVKGSAASSLDSNLADYLFQHLTFINAYQAIGLSPAPYQNQWHQTALVRDVKGTALYRGLTANDSSNVDMISNVTFDPKYWVGAGSTYNAPTSATLSAWTRANGTGMELGGLEWDQFANIALSDYAAGILFSPADRIATSASFDGVTVKNSTVAVDVRQLDSRWGVSFVRSSLTGSSQAISNASSGYVELTDSTTSGPTSGTVLASTPGTSPAPPVLQASPSVSRHVLYDAVSAYDAPSVPVETTAPTVDATPAIQAAINAASAAGGGVVYLRAGWYLLAGHLTVPANVEVRGVSPAARDNPGSSRGTVLWATEGRHTTSPDTATAAVTLSGNGAGLRSVRFFYPAGNPADGDGVDPYPFTVRLSGTGDYIVDVGMVASYNGIDAASAASDGHYIRDIQATMINRSIVVRSGPGGHGWVENVSTDDAMAERNTLQRVADWSGAPIRDKVIAATRVHEAVIEVQGTATSSEQILNVFGYGPYIGVHAVSGSAVVTNLGTDNLGANGYTALADAGASLTVSNLMRYNGAGSASGPVSVYGEMHL